MQDQKLEDRAEINRIRSVYDDYARDAGKQRAWADGTAHRFQLERKWACIRDRLAHESVTPGMSFILDLGAGSGTECPSLLGAGFRPERVIALDLNAERLHAARNKHPWLRALAGNGTMLPFRDETFDVVYQSTVISSVLDATRRVAILREAGRVLRSGGVLISYDTRYPNPWNRHTRPLPTAELRNALPGWNLSAISLTGIPQIIRPLSRISLSLCRMVEAVPVLRSHLLVSARKP